MHNYTFIKLSLRSVLISFYLFCTVAIPLHASSTSNNGRVLIDLKRMQKSNIKDKKGLFKKNSDKKKLLPPRVKENEQRTVTIYDLAGQKNPYEYDKKVKNFIGTGHLLGKGTKKNIKNENKTGLNSLLLEKVKEENKKVEVVNNPPKKIDPLTSVKVLNPPSYNQNHDSKSKSSRAEESDSEVDKVSISKKPTVLNEKPENVAQSFLWVGFTKNKKAIILFLALGFCSVLFIYCSTDEEEFDEYEY